MWKTFSYILEYDWLCVSCVCLWPLFCFFACFKNFAKIFSTFFYLEDRQDTNRLERNHLQNKSNRNFNFFLSFFLNSYITKTRDICSCLNLFLFFLVFNLFVPCLYSHPILIPSSINQPTQFSVHLPPTNPLFTWGVKNRSLLPYAF
jgi:hypothetical protein